ncbi:MAG TPA: EF-hand domain-containing protein [Ramlibacter sp.]|nr:EF-hand domain-containing protein [Ramlibacter sp.]
MNLRYLTCIALACAGVLATAGAAAQPRKITGVPQTNVPAPAPGGSTFALPNPAGLTPPAAGSLTPPMPPSLTPPGSPNLSSPGTPPGSPVIDAGIAAPTTNGGVAAATQSGRYGAASAMGFGGAASGPYSAVDIARAFLDADINHDGELSRAEAQRLTIAVPFDDLDRNRDGALTRFEYEDFFR